MKTETDFYGTTIKVGDIVDIDFGAGLTGNAEVVRIDNDALLLSGVGELEKASGSYSPHKKNQLMALPDGPGWSPDGGKYWVNGNVVYWHDGDTSDLRDGGAIRVMPGGYVHDENYYEIFKKKLKPKGGLSP